MFCGCELSFGDAPNSHTLPGLPGAARGAAGGQRAGDPLRADDRAGVRVRDRRALAVSPQELLLSRPRPRATRSPSTTSRCAAAAQVGDVRIHRVHLEEDAAKLDHIGASGRIHGADRSWVDFNRCGTPLVEIVTEPDLRSAEQAREWLRLLRSTLRVLGVSDVNMEEGSLRCDANVSVRPAGSTELGTKTELKNMNSFRFLERGVRAEIERQIGLLSAGEPVVQETLHFDPDVGQPDAAALQGGGARLPLLPRARSGPAGGDRGDGRGRPGRAARAAGRPGAALRARARAERRERAAARRSGPSSATTSSARSRPTATTRSRWPTGSRR